ncbi:MAG: IPT/TIG domain-containing protein, partial [Acidimicrobiales bacterium]
MTVITPGGTSATSPSDHFRYIAPVPTVSSVAPSAGPAAGGTSVTITGTGFTAATAVAFGFTAATTFAVVSDTQITATSPAH